MKTSVIQRSWIEGYGYRLDTKPYLSGALEAKVLLDILPLRKDKLSEVTAGIYHAGRESRQWVDSAEHGVPFISGSDLQKAEFTNLPFLSKRQVEKTPRFTVRTGYTLITRSGTIGRMAYCRRDMDGMACSEHVMRVVPDSTKIPAGYLYTYLCSKFGVPLVLAGTYGSMIQGIEPEHIAGLPVPRIGDALEHEIHTLVEQAAELRCTSSQQLKAAREGLLRTIGKPPPPSIGTRHRNWAGHSISSEFLAKVGRLDSLFYNPTATELDEWIAAHSAGFDELGDVAEVFDVPPFKHIYVGPDEGVGFFTSADIFLIDRKPDKYLSRRQTKGLEKYVLETGWVLLARSGSLGGNIAKPQFADSAMSGATASDHVIRIAPKTDRISAGYLYTYLSLRELGYPIILRTATGACIPALWPLYLNKLRVLRPAAEFNQKIDQTVREAFEMRVRATKLDDQARDTLEEALANAAK